MGRTVTAFHDHIEPGGIAYQHEHILLDWEDPFRPAHGHDEDRYGPFSPVYGPGGDRPSSS
jgi:hypothetical protein